MILVLLTYAYGTYVEPKQLTAEEHTVPSKNLTDNFDGFKIVHISDLHYGPYYNIDDLKLMN